MRGYPRASSHWSTAYSPGASLTPLACDTMLARTLFRSAALAGRFQQSQFLKLFLGGKTTPVVRETRPNLINYRGFSAFAEPWEKLILDESTSHYYDIITRTELQLREYILHGILM
jgi:hypothetical protein